MKNLFLKSTALCVLLFMGAGCGDQENPSIYDRCIKGNVIGYEQCMEATLIQLEDVVFGNIAVLYDSLLGKIEYSNVIKSTGLYAKGPIYFIAREYNREEDFSLLVPVPKACTTVYGPYDVPIVVITQYSQNQCPKPNGN